jgi:ABC-type Fe3+-hydroxamate transport system substrate-binding protein
VTRSLRDELGEPVALAGPPTSVVSIVPSLTEAVELTVPGVLTGATDYCVHPPGLVTTRIGGSKYPKVDEIIALRPQLVLANVEENREQDVRRLRAEGVPVWVSAAPDTVPAALGSLRRLCTEVFDVPTPEWLARAESVWRPVEPLWTTAIVPVWRKPWVVVGRDTFAGDVLRRLGIGNAYADAADRYPRPSHDELLVRAAGADVGVVVLPDEPYLFTATDGPESFPGLRPLLVSGRHLTWWGPSLADARSVLSTACGRSA